MAKFLITAAPFVFYGCGFWSLDTEERLWIERILGIKWWGKYLVVQFRLLMNSVSSSLFYQSVFCPSFIVVSFSYIIVLFTTFWILWPVNYVGTNLLCIVNYQHQYWHWRLQMRCYFSFSQILHFKYSSRWLSLSTGLIFVLAYWTPTRVIMRSNQHRESNYLYYSMKPTVCYFRLCK